jgi:hypothetical protein
MSIRVLADGADGFSLLSPANELMGWVRGRAIGVTGFADEDEVVRVAVHAYRKVAAWLERQGLTALLPIGGGMPSIVHDGAHRWITVDRQPVARILTSAPHHAPSPAASFEIVLRGSVSEGVAIHAALIALNASHGNAKTADIAWPARRGGARAPAASVAPTTHLDLEVR